MRRSSKPWRKREMLVSPYVPLVVAHGQVHDAQVQARGAEQQVEVAEGVEVAEVGAVRGDALVVLAVEGLGAAERVAHLLAEQPREEQGERSCWRAGSGSAWPGLPSGRPCASRSPSRPCRARAPPRTSARPRGRRPCRSRGSAPRRPAPRRSRARTASPLPLPGCFRKRNGRARVLGDHLRGSRPRCRRSSCPRRRGTRCRARGRAAAPPGRGCARPRCGRG